MIEVAGSDATRAWQILNENDLPKHKDVGYAEVFSQSGLVPTASEERAKMLMAIEGKLAHTLKAIDGVLDAQVNVVIPEDSVLRVKEEDKAEPTASVWFKYMPKQGKPPVTEQQVAELVANAVEKLKPDHVKVISTPATHETAEANPAMADTARLLGITIARADVGKFKLIITAAVILVFAFAVAFIYGMVRASANRRIPPRTMTRGGGPPAEPPAAAA